MATAACPPRFFLPAQTQVRPKVKTTGCSYFRQRYEARVEIDAQGRAHQVPLPNPMKEESLHFAISADGRHWIPLNRNRPVWEQWLRDPFLGRGPDDCWHLLATGGRPKSPRGETKLGPACLYATSRDLLKWDDVRSLRLMSGVRDENGRLARNIWAPRMVTGSHHGPNCCALVVFI